MSAVADLRAARDAVALSAPAVSRNPAEFAGQLFGRLFDADGEGISRLRETAHRWVGQPWLCPLTPSLTTPGGPLRHAISAHTDCGPSGPMGPTRAVAIGAGGEVAVSVGVDGFIRAWDLAAGNLLWEHAAKQGPAIAIAISADGLEVTVAFESGGVLSRDLVTGASRYEAEFQGEVKALSHSSVEPCVVVSDAGGLSLKCSHRGDVRPIGIPGSGPAALAADCRRVVVGVGSDLWVWDPDGGLVAGPLLGHGDEILCVAITPDGRRAVTGSRDKTLIVWDIDEGTILWTLIGHTGFVLDVSVGTGERGSRAVSTSTDRTAIVWDLEQSEEIGVIEGPVSFPRAFISADAGTVVTTTPEGILRVWDLARWEESRSDEDIADLAGKVEATLACDRSVVVYHIDSIRQWDLASGLRSGTRVGQSTIFGVWALGVTPDGMFALTAGSTSYVEVWDLRSGSLMRTFATPHEGIKSLAVTADGTRVVSVSDGSVAVSDFDTGQLVLHTRVDWADSAQATADANRLLLLGKGRLAILDLASDGVPTVLLETERGVALPSRDGRFAIVSDHEGQMRLVELDGEGHRIALGGDVAWLDSLAVSAESGRVVGVRRAGWSVVVVVWDLQTGNLLSQATFGGDSRPFMASFVSVDGTRVAATENGGRTHFLELRAFA